MPDPKDLIWIAAVAYIVTVLVRKGTIPSF
jgi:hypothetical protein